ncbi:homeobox protein 2-like [Argiope bruennichi]|uniref:homeobox protein 2-like n=1 Tax=Argiope bruennichi TaxID=94029 RepID=UPI002494BD0F|nr:homeobox protein 2-like [Argiope bruennichi]
MEPSYQKRLILFLVLFSLQFFNSNILSYAGEATPATSKEVQFSGWKPMGEPEALSTSQFVKKFSNPKDQNETDIATSETRKSYLLIYPPRQENDREQQPKPSGSQQSQVKNFGPPVRASPTQSRYHRMVNFGASEGSNKRNPTVYQRPKFPPVANPPPLPPHAVRQKKVLPNFKSESTSQHQVQIQLLDGYIVPPGGNGVSTIHAKEKGPQITTYPLAINNVPEIRLLLPGDVHDQLTNIQQSHNGQQTNNVPPHNVQQANHVQQPHNVQQPNNVQQPHNIRQPTNIHPPIQQNHVPQPYPEQHAPILNEKPDVPPQEFHNAEAKIPNPIFESQRYPENGGPRNQLPSNNNYDNSFQISQEPRQQQIHYEQNQNIEQHRPLNVFSQPDPNGYANGITFPDQSHQNYQSNINHGQNNVQQNYQGNNNHGQNNVQQNYQGNNNHGQNNVQQNYQGNNNQAQNIVHHGNHNQGRNNAHLGNDNVGPNNVQQNFQTNYVNEFSHSFEAQNNYETNKNIDVREPVNQVKIQSFSNVQRNRYVQNTGRQQQNDEQVFTQKSNQPGVYPSYPGQVQRGYRGEGFRPLSNGNYNNQNTNQGPLKNAGGTQQVPNNNQYNNVQKPNLGQNTWRAQQPIRGKTNYNRISPEQQNFYTINNNQNLNTQAISKINNQNPNTNYNNQNNGKRNIGGNTNRPPTSIQDALNQQKLIETDIFTSTETDGGYQTSTDKDVSTQQIFGNRNTTSQGNLSDQVYFIPSLPSQDDVQTQIQAFDVQKKEDDDVDSNIGTTNVVGEDVTLIQQKELEPTSDSFTTSTGVIGLQLDARSDTRSDRSGTCDCSQSCAPLRRLPSENFGTSIREIARSLNADAFFEFVGLSDQEIESMLTVDGPYTLFIPSNEAVSRLPSNLVDHWRENNPDFTMALLNHVIQDVISLDQLKQGGRLTSRANSATIFVNNYNNEAVTVNGHRIVHGDVNAPKGGVIHVIDGTLCPVADQDIINTLRTCNKYDGFLTLADVTKLLDTMQDDGPYTVFLPSNEALTKIPADELSVLKENVTLLREFLEYHVVQGAYFSGDLKDGQYLTTLHQKQPIRVGVRVDGCYRRLVEANNSPLFKADIPTKNGVIHVIDWILRPSDLSWCEGVILP